MHKLKKVTEEYKKYQATILLPVDEAYLESIKALEKDAKKKTRTIK